MRRSRKRDIATSILISMFFMLTIFIPLVINFLEISLLDIPEIIFSQLFKEALKNSIVTSIIAAAISLGVSFGAAYIIERTRIKYKNFWRMLFLVPMLIPSISHGLGLINVFGDNGLVTVMLGIDINLYGFNGIVMGSVMYTFPIGYLMISDVLRYLDVEIYEAARVLSIPKYRVFKDITLGTLKKPLIATYFVIFTMIFTDYGIPLAVGGKFSTLAVLLYREVVGLLDFSKGGVIAFILLIPAIITFIIDLKFKNIEGIAVNPGSWVIKENKIRDFLSLIICIFIGGMIFLPIFSCIMMSVVKSYPRDMSFSLQHIRDVWSMGLEKYLVHSIIIAMSTALIGTVVAYLIAYQTTRIENKKMERVLHLFSLISLVVPGMVLGLGYVQMYGGSWIYGTVIILIMVNIAHFFSTPYILAYNALKQVSVEIEHMGEALGIKRWRLLKDVIVPSTQNTIIEMFSYFFINAMITISAVSFLYNTKNMPVSLMINQLEGQLMLEGAAVVAIVILGINVLFKIFIYMIKKYLL